MEATKRRFQGGPLPPDRCPYNQPTDVGRRHSERTRLMKVRTLRLVFLLSLRSQRVKNGARSILYCSRQ